MALSHDQIVKLAGEAAFVRALLYQREGRVEGVLRSGSTVMATVRGSVPYRVKLGFGAPPTWSCDCPVGVDGTFCKHCAALAIELLDPKERTLFRGRSEHAMSPPTATLGSLTRAQLEEIVRLAAARDARVAHAVETAAASSGGAAVDAALWAKRIDTAFRTGGFVPYRDAPDWAAGINEVLDGLSDLVDAGYAAEVVGLAERAHRKLERSMNRVDDSGGEITMLCGVIAELHLRAAAAARPGPAAFARRLAKLEMDGELDTFRRAALTYADVLGEKGLREYRKVVEPKWRNANDGPYEQWSHDRFVTTEAMIGVALAAGDPDELVAILKDRLRTPDDYLDVARAMEGAGRRGEAILWARRGLTSMGTRFWQTGSVREFLASLYVADGEDEAAEALWWEDFRLRPSVESYRRVMAESRSTDPTEVREQAIGELQARAQEAADSGRASTRATVLVGVLLYEGRIDEAWDVATRYDVDPQSWMKLAQARESGHPLEAIPIYEREIAARIEKKTAAGYRDAVRLLKRVEKLAASGGKPEVFGSIVTRLVDQHRRKPSLMEQLHKAGWV